jgi:hypothetical protein
MEKEDIIEFGAASEETKGIGEKHLDVPLGQPQTGILDD